MEIINRPEIEARLARIVGRDLRAELNRLMDFLGDPPALANIPDEYWTNGWRDIQKDVEPALLDIFLGQAEGLMAEIGIGVNWDQVNLTASRWASDHLEDMLSSLFGRRYEHLNEVIPRFYEEGWDLGQLRTELERWYSPVRADMIAVTETTRASVEGERAYVEQLRAEGGFRLVPVWLTANDELVCPICGPKHNKEIIDGIYPPAHPRCRCNVGYDLPENMR